MGVSTLAERHLVVVTGPVGGGKSTVALALAQYFRRRGLPAAVIDLDLVYCMARQTKGFGELSIWMSARRVTAALVDAFFSEGVDAVIVEGEFFNQMEFDALRGNVATPVELGFFTLMVSYDEALKRVSGDPSRGMSRDPKFLKWLHQQFASALGFLQDSSMVVDADSQSPDELAEAIGRTMLSGSATGAQETI